MSDAFESAILRALSRIGPGESISPAEAAREASQETGVEWEQLLKAVRRAAVKLALEGRAVILLKGEAVDPERFRGIYRIGGGDYFTPLKAAPAYTPPRQPFAPARDYKPEPRPYTPPPAPPAQAPPPAAAPAPAPVRLAVRVNAPSVQPAPPAPVAVAPLPPPAPPEPLAHPRLEPQHPSAEDASFEEVSLEDAPFEEGTDEAPVAAEAGWVDEGTPVTRFEFDPHNLEKKSLHEDAPDFLDETPAEDNEADAPAPLPPLGSSLSFDDGDDYEDEDAHRAPRSATLDDIASELERYLAAEFDNPARGNAEIGDNVVRLPRQQDE